MEQKIIYPETTNGANFYLDKKCFFIEKTCFMITGKCLEYITATLSSLLFEFAYKRIFSSIELGKKGYQYNKHALVTLPVAHINKKQIDFFKMLINEIMHKGINKEIIETINKEIFKIYDLNLNEIRFLKEIECSTLVL